MSRKTTRHAVAAVAAGALVAGGLVFTPAPASADYTYTAIPQSQMSVVEVDGSVRTSSPDASETR